MQRLSDLICLEHQLSVIEDVYKRQEQMDEIEEAIEEAKEQAGEHFTVKQLENCLLYTSRCV